MEMDIELGSRSYKIHIEKTCFFNIPKYLGKEYMGKKLAIITDDNVKELYAHEFIGRLSQEGIDNCIYSIKPGEESKNLIELGKIYEFLAFNKIGREDLIITLGGGVVGDIGGFAAATYLRGIDLIQIPTTLISQVDSSIGGKVAIDLATGKNLVGSFYQPRAVFIDSELLRTLNDRVFRDGLAEVIKYGFIQNKEIINILMKKNNREELVENIDDIIYKCCSIKKNIVEVDEMDRGERMLLNFGHTLGHALESYFDYRVFTHGEAVALGMLQITKNTEELGITEGGTYKKLLDVLMKYELPVELPEIDRKALLDIILLDKKKAGKSIKLIILTKMGEGRIENISVSEIEKYL